jgi:hypothetical protein
MPEVDLDPLEEIFRASLFKMLKDEEKITDELINKLMSWRHSGFGVHNGVRVEERPYHSILSAIPFHLRR